MRLHSQLDFLALPWNLVAVFFETSERQRVCLDLVGGVAFYSYLASFHLSCAAKSKKGKMEELNMRQMTYRFAVRNYCWDVVTHGDMGVADEKETLLGLGNTVYHVCARDHLFESSSRTNSA